jgi:hypothetical protein
MLITAFFIDRGVPKTGLSPLVSIWESDGNFAVKEESMIERAGGFYDYDFVGHNKDKNYTIRADGGSSLSLADRYKFNSNEVELGEVWDKQYSEHIKVGSFGEAFNAVQTDMEFVKHIEGGRWKIDTVLNQMIFYEADNITEVARFNLKDESGDPAHENIFERVRV